MVERIQSLFKLYYYYLPYYSREDSSSVFQVGSTHLVFIDAKPEAQVGVKLPEFDGKRRARSPGQNFGVLKCNTPEKNFIGSI